MGGLPTRTELRALVVDPKQPKRVYAAGDTGLYRSGDAGRTWQTAGRGLPDGPVAALTLDPRQPQRLYAAVPGGAIYLSDDGAESWRALLGAGSGAK